MRQIAIVLLALAMVFTYSMSSRAELIDRGGGLIYDTVLNITWLQDANYAKTSDYDMDGAMTWEQAMNWVENLVYEDPVRSVHWSAWRLPHTLPINGTSYNFNFPSGYGYGWDGTCDIGYNITSPNSEMGFMFHVNLGNKSYFDTLGNFPQLDYGLKNTYPFVNLVSYHYWSETEYFGYGSPAVAAWNFNFSMGIQNEDDKTYNLYAWAVRDGDIVDIDILPDDQSNTLNLKRTKKISVAILSTPDFDAPSLIYPPSLVQPPSLTFGPTGVELSFINCARKPRDINQDGLKDLICNFSAKVADFQCGDVEGVLKGDTVTGISFEGRQSVSLTPCN